MLIGRRIGHGLLLRFLSLFKFGNVWQQSTTGVIIPTMIRSAFVCKRHTALFSSEKICLDFFLENSAVQLEGSKIMKNDDGRRGASAKGIRKTPQSRGNHNLPTTLLLIFSAQYKRARTIGRFIIKSDRGQIGTMHSLPSSAQLTLVLMETTFDWNFSLLIRSRLAVMCHILVIVV